MKTADVIALVAKAIGENPADIATLATPTGADYMLIFRPKAPKAEAPKASEGPANPAASAAVASPGYTLAQAGDGTPIRWRPGMAAWEPVPMAAPPAIPASVGAPAIPAKLPGRPRKAG